MHHKITSYLKYCRQISKNWINLLLAAILFIVFIIPFIYILTYCKWPQDNDFWDNAMGNMLATVLALIAGIPIAFWIDRLVKRQSIKDEYLRDRKKEKEILLLIKEELNFSYNSIFLSSMKGNTRTLSPYPLKSDLWDAIISSDQIKFIEDPILLNRITSAYYVLKVVKTIEQEAYIASRTSAIEITLPDGIKLNAAQLLVSDARLLDQQFEDNIKKALEDIDKRLRLITELTP